ncbi:response regulator [Paenibacillus sp. sgz302251]|uniref:response regulator n=1 Tax=Paenibacillus sp. sgz302251 TaxID=3414493 RepID=UPI003C7CFCEA
MASIILADDDKSILLLLKEFIKLTSHQVVASFDNGKEALEYYLAHSPDLLITDFQMPAMDGIELSKRILSLDSHALIILCTGEPAQIKSEAESLGIQLLEKPFKMEYFFEIVERILREK